MPGQEDKRIITERFTKDSYNGPRLQDFINRLDRISDTAKAMANETQTAKINAAKQQALDTLNADCHIRNIPIRELLKKEKEVVNKITIAEKEIAQFIANIYPILKHPEEKKDDFFKRLQKAESEFTAAQTRPDFVHYYPSDLSDTPFSTRISTQIVVGDAIPSTKRDIAKLPNFVKCEVGYETSNKKAVRQFVGYRHSSYPPIGIENKFERRRKTAVTVLEMLHTLAKEKIKAGELHPNHPDPIPLKLASLALLSPVRGDKAIMKNESEQRQLQETYTALKMYDAKDKH